MKCIVQIAELIRLQEYCCLLGCGAMYCDKSKLLPEYTNLTTQKMVLFIAIE
jgi:hypothetical protein